MTSTSQLYRLGDGVDLLDDAGHQGRRGQPDDVVDVAPRLGLGEPEPQPLGDGLRERPRRQQVGHAEDEVRVPPEHEVREVAVLAEVVVVGGAGAAQGGHHVPRELDRRRGRLRVLQNDGNA